MAGTLSKDKFEESFKKEHPAYEFSKIDCNNVDSLHLMLEIKGEMNTTEGINAAGDRIYFKPFLAEGITKNPFQKPERKYPVDFGAPSTRSTIALVTLPEGYTVEEMPKNEAFALPENGGRFTFAAQLNGNKLQINSRLMILKPIFFAEEYNALRAFYDKIVAKYATQIVLKKPI